MKNMQPESKEKRKILLQALARSVKKFREKKGKSITLISNELNVSKSIWSDVELGKSDIQFSTFWRISEALEIAPEDLMADIRDNLPNILNFIE